MFTQDMAIKYIRRTMLKHTYIEVMLTLVNLPNNMRRANITELSKYNKVVTW